ncbi:hypothetical protein ACYSNW_00855 [Enterococcus sp. LJL99]
MKKVIVLVALIAVLLVGCSSKKYPSKIEANNRPNENRIDYKKLLDNIDQENYDQAIDISYNLKQQYPNDYMVNRISKQIDSYLSAKRNISYNRDWETALKDLEIAEGNDGSKKIMEDAKELKKQIDRTKKTFDGHSTERERMFQAGATSEAIEKVSDQEINSILKLSENKGEPEPHKAEYLFIKTMAEEHPELNMSIKKYELYWGKEQ